MKGHKWDSEKNKRHTLKPKLSVEKASFDQLKKIKKRKKFPCLLPVPIKQLGTIQKLNRDYFCFSILHENERNN